MNEELTTTTEQQDTDVQKYLDAIQDLKTNTVSKGDYARLQEENAKLLKSLVDGSTIQNTSTEVAAKPDIEKLGKSVLSGKGTQLKFFEDALALREAVLDRDGVDIFSIPKNGYKITGTPEDDLTAQKVADTIQGWIEYADGNPEIFRDVCQRQIIDNIPKRMKK